MLVPIFYFRPSIPKPVPKLEQIVIGRAWDLSTDNSPDHVVSPTQRAKAVGTEYEVESRKGKGKRNSPEVQDASPEGDFIDPDNNPASKGKVAPSNKTASDKGPYTHMLKVMVRMWVGVQIVTPYTRVQVRGRLYPSS